MPYMAGGLRFPNKSHIPCSAMAHVRSIQQYGYYDQVSFKLFPLIIHNTNVIPSLDIEAMSLASYLNYIRLFYNDIQSNFEIYI